MEAKPIGNFPIIQVRTDDSIIHMVHDDTTVYIAIECNGESLNGLHRIMRRVQAQNRWMPNFLPPTLYQQTPQAYLAVECFNRLPLTRLDTNWYFIRATVNYSPSSKKWNPVLLYPTMRFKKLIWSILRTVFAFLDTRVRPILDVNSMFVSKDYNVIFSRYELRVQRHDRKFEAAEIISVLKFIVTSKAKTSSTIKAEFGELYKWLGSSTSTFGAQPQLGILPPLNNALKNVVFWGCRMRITYIQILGDFVIRDRVSIFPEAEHAFAVGVITDWRDVMERNQNPVLMKILDIGDKHHARRTKEHKSGTILKPPSFLRKGDISKYSPKDVLRSGVVRIRDSFYHIYQMKKQELTRLYSKSDVSDEDLHGMYQYIYPCHMVKLAEVQEQIKFNAVEYVLGSFAQTQVEDDSVGKDSLQKGSQE